MKAVIYGRYSSDRQREESIEGQLRECREYAKRNDITVVGEYIDRALSASKDTDKRLDFLRMIRDSGKRLFDVVLVWKLDRFARDRYDSAHYKHLLKKNGVKVISVTEHIGDGPEGIILEAMLEGMAEYYSAELSEKIHRGQKENALKGLNNGGRIPFGYQLNLSTQKLEINPGTAPIVKEIFQRYAAGDTIREIKDDLNKRGITTNQGCVFRYSTLNTILKNRKYIGEYRYQDVVLPNEVPKLVPADVFERVQKQMDKNRLTPAAGKADDPYLLTTKLFCGHCGKTMVGESGKSRGKVYRYYKCHSSKNKLGCTMKPVKKEWIENAVIRYTMALVLDDSLMQRLTNRLVEVQGEENYDVKFLEQQLNEVEQAIENMLNAIQAGIVTSATKQRMIDLEEKRKQLEQDLITARIKNPVLSREQIASFLEQFKNTDCTDQNQRQRLIDYFVNAVYLYEDRIVLTFNYKNGTKTITLKELAGSDMETERPP